MNDEAHEEKGLSPETLELLSPEYQKKSEEESREMREICERMERRLAETRRLREILER